MTLFLPATVPARDRNGAAEPAAVWEFYSKGTLTPEAVNGGMTSATANGEGVFQDVILTGGIPYRAVLKDDAGAVLYDISSYDSTLFAAGIQAALSDGDIVPGARWKFYATTTTDPRAVFSDPERTVPLGPAVKADARGVFPEIYLDAAVTYKAVLETPAGTELATIDPVTQLSMAQYLNPTGAIPVGSTDLLLYREDEVEAPSAIGVTTTANRFKLTADGFERVAANEARTAYNGATYLGNLMQPAAEYVGAPWNVASGNTSGDPAYLLGTTANLATVEYAGAHSEPDIFGGTGGGVKITYGGNTGARWEATNLSVAVDAGDTVRVGAILRLEPGESGRLDLRMEGFGNFGFEYDATGAFTGVSSETWTTWRSGFYRYPFLINGEQFWFLWIERKATGIATIEPGIGTTGTPTGFLHIQDLWIQKNPTDAPCAVPVCGSYTFAADAITTGISTTVGFVLHPLCARSLATGGVLATPSIDRGLPYLPICSRVDVLASTEVADRAGPMPNENIRYYGRAWGSPTTLDLNFGPAWFPRNTVSSVGVGETAGTINVRSVFRNRKDLMARVHGITTSQTRLTNLSLDGVIGLPAGSTNDVYWQQTSVNEANDNTLTLIADQDVGFTNGLYLGQTLWATRAAYSVQADDTDAKRVYTGRVELETVTGGDFSIAGTRFHNCPRVFLAGASRTVPINLTTTGAAFTQFWMDALYISRGTIPSWAGDDMFGALTTAHQSLFFNQSERAVRVSEDGGETWQDLDASGLTIPELPHGELGEHIGTYNFDTLAFTSAPDATKSLRVRYWFPSNSRPNVFGYQWTASQMDMGTHTQWPTNGDVFRIKKGNLWVDVTYQTGRYTTTTTYLRNTTGTPAVAAEAISNDFVQINRTDVVLDQTYTLDGSVWIGPKGGFFLTGNPQLNANGSIITGVTVQNNIGVHNGTNGFRFDWSLQAGSTCTLANAVFVEARSDRTLADGQGRTLTIGGAGPNNTLTFDNVTVISSANVGGLASAEAGATYVNESEVTTILAGRRTNYDDFAAPDAKVAQYLPAEFYDAVQGRALLPAPDRIFDFRFTTFAETDTGLPLNTVIETAVGNHPDWNPVIAALKAKFHKAPTLRVVTANTAAVGTVLGSISSTGFDLYDHGNHEGYFEIVGGQLRVAKPLTGLDAVFPLVTMEGNLIVVDVTT